MLIFHMYVRENESLLSLIREEDERLPCEVVVIAVQKKIVAVIVFGN